MTDVTVTGRIAVPMYDAVWSGRFHGPMSYAAGVITGGCEGTVHGASGVGSLLGKLVWTDVNLADCEELDGCIGLGYGTLTMTAGGQTTSGVMGIIRLKAPVTVEWYAAHATAFETALAERWPDAQITSSMPYVLDFEGFETQPALSGPCAIGLRQSLDAALEPYAKSADVEWELGDIPSVDALSRIFQRILTAGDHISISDENVISANGFQPVLTAGANITISEQNVISAAGGGPERLDITLKNLASGSINMTGSFRIYTVAASNVYQQFTPSTQPYQIASLKVPAAPTTVQYTPWQGNVSQAASGKAVRLPFTDDGSVTHMPGAFQIAVMVGPNHWQRSATPVDVITLDVKSVDNCVKDLIIKPHSNFEVEIGGDAVLEPSVPMGAIFVLKATLSGDACKVYIHCELSSTKVHAGQMFNTNTGTDWIGNYQELSISRVVAAYATVPNGHTASEYSDADVVLTAWESSGNMIIPVAAVRDPAAVLNNTNCVLTLEGWYTDFK